MLDDDQRSYLNGRPATMIMNESSILKMKYKEVDLID
jgi:hypothetical protein